MPASVRGRQPEDRAAQVGVEQRRALAGEVGQREEAAGPGPGLGGLGIQLLVAHAAGQLAQPGRERPARGDPGGEVERPRREPDRAPEPGVGPRRAVDLDEEHAGAVDEQSLPGASAAPTPRPPPTSRWCRPRPACPPAIPVAAAASRLTHAARLVRPDQPGQRQPGGDVRDPLVDPRVLVDVVQRRPVTGAVVVEHVLAGEARDEVGGRAEDASGGHPHVAAPLPRASAAWGRPTGSRAASRSGRGSRRRRAPRSAARPGRWPASRCRTGSRAAAAARRASAGRTHGPRALTPTAQHALGAAREQAAARLDHAAPPDDAPRPARPSRDAAARSRARSLPRQRPRRRRRRAPPWCSTTRRRGPGRGPRSPCHPPVAADGARVTPPRRSRGRACRRT